MDTTTLGRSTVRVTRLSYGAAAIGNLYQSVDDDAALGAVEAAWAEGIRAFDTAPHYGLGLSERRLGQFLRDQPRESFTISTKVGRILEPVAHPEGDDLAAGGFAVPATHLRRWDFSADGINRSLAESLERLGLDRVDIVYLHDPDDHAEQALAEAYPALEKLRAQGVVGAIGLGIKQSALPARFVRETDIDAVLLAGRYTLLDQSGLDDLLPVAAERGVGIVIGGVFNSGVLADPRSDSAYEYGAVPQDVLARALRMKAVCEENGVSLRAAALQFPFGHPAVSSVLIGSRTEAEVQDAAGQARGPVPAAVWEQLRADGLLAEHVPVPGERPVA
jgi:D-threo-aldose 1-dehydrogenase